MELLAVEALPIDERRLAANEYVVVTKAQTRTVYKRKGMGKEEVRSKNPLKASKKAAAGRG